MITDIEDYFTQGCGRCDRFATPDCATQLWAEGLAALRRVCLDTGLIETLKWGHPCYMHAGRNIVIIGAHRGGIRLSFFNAALMKDPEGILEKQGPNTQHADVIRFAKNDAVARQASVLRAYLQEAIGYAAAGIKAPQVERAIELPDEMIEALDSDPELAEAYSALTPGRQRSYVINLSSAKTSATRTSRITKFRDKIIAGKGAMDR